MPLIVIEVVGEVAGTPGEARSFIWDKIESAAPLVTLGIDDDTGITSYQWEIQKQPPGASVSLSSQTAASPTFTPEVAVPGTYRGRVVLNGSIVVKWAVAWEDENGIRFPAVGETKEFGEDGWDAAIRVIAALAGAAGVDTWQEIAGGSVTAVNQVTVPSTDENYIAMFKGSPVKVKDSSGNYRFAVIDSYASGVVTVKGPDLTVGAISELYVGGADKVFQMDIDVPGLWDGGTSTTLINDFANAARRWHSGRSFLAHVHAKTKTPDSTSAPTINITIGGNDVLSSALSVGSSWGAGDGINESNYAVDFNDVIEVANVGAGGTNDAENLTVSLTFILDKANISLEPGDPYPYIVMTIGPTGGKDWCGLGEGVHDIVPDIYNWTTYEVWRKTSGDDKLQLIVSSSLSTSAYLIQLDGVFANSYYSTGVTGKIKDRLFKTGLVVNGVTITWSRGGSLWP